MTTKKTLRVELFFELLLLFSMLITLIIPPIPASIAPWAEIPPLLFIRAFVWLVGLSLLPGLHVLRLTEVGKNFSKLERITISINLSFVFLGLTSVFLFYFQKSINYLIWFLLGIILVFVYLNLNKYKVYPLIGVLKISKLNFLLLAGIIFTIVLSFFFQYGQRYLLPGDIWVSLKPAIEIITERNLYEIFKTTYYPLMFGHMLVALSICLGLPIVNTYVVLFPLAALNLLSFFIFVKIVFNMDDKISTIASLIYGFGAGLGFIIQFTCYNEKLSFMILYRLTADISLPNILTILFYHKSLALTLSFISVVLFINAIKIEKSFTKILTLIISILLLIFSFYIHMIEALIFYPMILIASYIYLKKRHSYIISGLYTLVMLIITYILDLLMKGYYYWLAFYKIKAIISIVGLNKILKFSIIILTGLLLIHIVRYYLLNKLVKFHIQKHHLKIIKYIIISTLLIIYISGLWFWKHPSPPRLFPWYRYVTRYGFIGVLALVGVASSRWREKWFLSAFFWSLYIVLLGRMWWESRISGYLTPLVALFASIGILEIWKKSYKTIYIKVSNTQNTIEKTLSLSFKPITSILIVSISLLSIISTIYGTNNYYGWARPCISDDVARTFAWINENVPENNTVLVPEIYNIYRGVETISDRKIYYTNNLPTTIDTNLIEILDKYNIRYIVIIENEYIDSSVLRVLISNSTLVFQSGDVKVFWLPVFS